MKQKTGRKTERCDIKTKIVKLIVRTKLLEVEVGTPPPAHPSVLYSST